MLERQLIPCLHSVSKECSIHHSELVLVLVASGNQKTFAIAMRTESESFIHEDETCGYRQPRDIWLPRVANRIESNRIDFASSGGAKREYEISRCLNPVAETFGCAANRLFFLPNVSQENPSILHHDEKGAQRM